MKIKFTDGYNKKTSSNQQDIDVSGSCVITDYDPRTKKPSQKDDLTVSVDKGKATINGTVFQEDSAEVNFNENKYSIFTKLASYDGDNSNLTLDDLEEAYKKKDTFKEFIINLGVKEVSIRFDSHAGVMTIEFDKEIIRIDFNTWWERWGLVEDSSELAIEETDETQETEPETKPVKETPKVETQKPEIMFYDAELDNVINKMNKGQTKTKITREELNEKIKNIAKNTGCSELLIIYIMSSEGFKRQAGKVGKYGIDTVGFGHTVKAIHNNGFKEGYEISNETAFDWLEQDIIDVINKIKVTYLPDIDWNHVPQSILDALIDLAFNVGESVIAGNKEVLEEALRTGSFVDAAVKISKLNPTKSDLKDGLMKRSCYRLLLAIEDLPADQRLEAIDKYDSYYTKTVKLQNSSDRALLVADWLDVKESAEKELGTYEEKDGIVIHRVKDKEVLWDVAKQYCPSNILAMIKRIKEQNGLKNDTLYRGQRLEIPIDPAREPV